MGADDGEYLKVTEAVLRIFDRQDWLRANRARARIKVFVDKFGIDERDTTNNHATCWVMQVAAFAHYTGNQALMRDARTRFKTVLLQHKMQRPLGWLRN